MNVPEGARRMKRAGQWMIFIPLAAGLVSWGIGLIGFALHREFSTLGSGGFVFLFLFAYLAIPGGALWIAGWIVEGFAKKEP